MNLEQAIGFKPKLSTLNGYWFYVRPTYSTSVIPVMPGTSYDRFGSLQDAIKFVTWELEQRLK